MKALHKPTFDRTDLEGGTCVVRLADDIDAGVAPELRKDLGSALDTGCVNIILDLSDVTYVDSSALGLLAWLNSRLMSIDGRVALVGANSDVTRIFELSGLVALAPTIVLSPSVDAALTGLDVHDTFSEPLWSEVREMPSDVGYLSHTRDEVAAIIAPLAFPAAAVFDIKVAVGEALANAVRHGGPEDGQGTVRIVVSAYEDRVVLEVSDKGRGFDGEDVPDDDVYAPGGRGITFMRALMDRVQFEPVEPCGTLVRLVKRRAPA